MASATAQLKRRMKFGPKMGRECRAEYLLTQVNAGPRRLTPATVAKLRVELARLAQSTNPRVRRFVGQMKKRYPEVAALSTTFAAHPTTLTRWRP
jgi:hypothetical protein